jgi:hypothetical protein
MFLRNPLLITSLLMALATVCCASTLSYALDGKPPESAGQAAKNFGKAVWHNTQDGAETVVDVTRNGAEALGDAVGTGYRKSSKRVKLWGNTLKRDMKPRSTPHKAPDYYQVEPN